jgi:tetratricopeptide (TPR) repeat protein
MIPNRRTQIILILCLCAITTSRSFAQSSPSAPSSAPQKPSVALQPPFDRLELLAFVAARWDSRYELQQVRERGLDFTPDSSFLEALAHLHLSVDSIETIKSIKPRPSARNSAEREQAYRLVLGAVQNLSTGEHADAAEKYEQALLFAPDSATLHFAYAGYFMLLRRYHDAEIHARRSLELWSDDAEAHVTLSAALVAELREAEAISEAREALRIYPKHKAALVTLSMALTRDGQYKEAIPVLREAISRTPEVPTLHAALGNCLTHTGELSEAAQELTAYLSRNSDDGEAHYYLGVVLRAQRHHDEAMKQFQEAVRLAPDNPLAAAAATDDATASDPNPGPGPHPEDGWVSGNAYTNQFFGFTLDFPQGWIVMDQEQSRAAMSLGAALIQTGDPISPDVIAASRKQTIPLLFVMRGGSGGQALRTGLLEVMATDART